MATNRSVIKGITIKIGGDTTELGKAMESINKQGDTLTDELREINRQLKFDPENTDLLAQRQKVLAETVDNTKERLRQLKEAERQVQEQFERGEVSEAQVRALQREIIATEGKLESYEQQAKEATEGTKKLGDEADGANEGFTVMKGVVSDLASRGIASMVSGIKNLLTSFAGLADSTREYRTEMGKLTSAFETVGHRTEIAEEAYKRLYGVIGETDQTVEASQQIALLAESEEDVIQWADLGAGVIARFGDALQPETFFEAANETIKLGEATGAYVQLLEGAGYNVDEFNRGLAECTTESEKQAYMLKVTDEILGDAADTYRETNEAVISANEANRVWAATLAEAGAALEPISTDVKMLKASLVSELMPGIVSVTDALKGMLAGEEGSADALGEAVSFLIMDVLDKVVELLPTATETAMSLITTLTTTIIEMLPDLVETGIDIITAILDGISTAIPEITQAIVDMLPRLVQALVEGIPQLIDGAVQLLTALLDAIPLILPPLIEALPQILTAIIDGLLDATPELIEGAVQFLLAIVDAVPLLIKELLPQVPTIVDAVIDGLLDNLPVLIDGAIELLFGILDAIPEIKAALIEEIPDVVTTIVDGLIAAIPDLIEAGGQLLAGLVKGMLNFDVGKALKKVGDGIVNGFKKVFDIHSPSRVMAEIGEFLDEGLAEGITDGATAPISALDKLSGDMLDSVGALNGASVEHRVSYANNAGATETTAAGLASKLDQIIKTLKAGQVIMLDGKTLVGSTAERYDTELGQRRVLAERGAI